MKDFKNIKLSKDELRSIEAAATMLKTRFSAKKVILFGSQARGDSDQHSDIDLLLISPNPLHWKEEKAVVEALFDTGIENDVIFSPLFTSSNEWEEGMFKWRNYAALL
jgi:predicted nucleotidyltransferase